MTRRVWANIEIDDRGTLRLRITVSTVRHPVEHETLVIDQDGQHAIGEKRLAQNIGEYMLAALSRV